MIDYEIWKSKNKLGVGYSKKRQVKVHIIVCKIVEILNVLLCTKKRIKNVFNQSIDIIGASYRVIRSELLSETVCFEKKINFGFLNASVCLSMLQGLEYNICSI
jgi:hypothetical protein